MQLHDRRWHQRVVIIYRDPHNYTKREKSFLFGGLNFLLLFFRGPAKQQQLSKWLIACRRTYGLKKKNPKGKKNKKRKLGDPFK
jgi:hypothetical protein